MITHREVLEHAKAVWIAAAVRNQRQFLGEKGTTGRVLCAATILHGMGLPILHLGFTCPDHDRSKDINRNAFHLNRMHYWNVIHFNDKHRWDWLTLARKLGKDPYTLRNPEKIMWDFWPPSLEKGWYDF